MLDALRNREGNFRPDIEGLRGIAVLLVVLFHCGVPRFRGGFTGVDVFFALSGYLITGLIVNEVERSGQLSFRNFYARRVRRLLPASGLTIVVTLLLSLVLYSPLELAAYGKWGYYTSLYISNYAFMHDAANYFASDVAKNPFLHFWSLAVEEQFYFLWPALVTLSLTKLSSRRSLAKVLLPLCVISFALCVWLTHVRQPWAFFSLPTRAWEFGLGGLACLLRKSELTAYAKWMQPMGWAGLAGILAAGYFYSPETRFPGYAAAIPVGGTIVALISGASGGSSSLQTFLASRVLQYLGRLSYSWYLWHWPVLIFTSVYFPHITWLGKLVPAACALLLAQVTFLVLEKPIRLSPYLFARPALSLGLAVFIPAIGLVTGYLLEVKTYHLLASGDQHKFWAAANDSRTLFKAKCLAVAGVARLSECQYGDNTSSTVAVLFGDSHAEQWFPALEPIANEKHWRLVTVLKSSCPAARVKTYNIMLKRMDNECSSWREAALSRIAQLHPRVIILAESDGYVESRAEDSAYVPRVSALMREEGLRSTLSFLNSQGLNTIVLADVPRADFDVPICLSRAAAHSWKSQECLLNRETALNSDARQAEAAAVATFKNAKLVDFVDSFCTGSLCQTVIRGQVVYRDSNHLTSSFARNFKPSLEREIDSLVETK